MTANTLRRVLIDIGVRPDVFTSDPSQDEAYVLVDEGGWCVFYSERGQRTNEQLFDSESDACEYLLSVIARDPTTRR